MERLYCPECGNYLEGGDGSMVDCCCGWKQERSLVCDESEIEQLRQRVSELESELEYKREVSECHAIDLRERDAAIKSYVAQITTLKSALRGAKELLDPISCGTTDIPREYAYKAITTITAALGEEK